MNNEMQTGRKAFSTERFVWELQRAFYSFRNGPVLAILLFQIAAFIVVHAKGAGSIYRDMIGILFLITLVSWFFTSVIHGNKKILICALILLTVGTMLQCIMEQEQIIKNPELLEAGNPAAGLQLQYLLGFAAACVAAGGYRRWKQISGMKMCRILVLLSFGLSVFTLIASRAVGNVRNWINIGGMSIQTTELVKLFYVLIAAALLGTTEKPSKQRIRVFYGITVVEILLLAAQSEFGTMLLLLFIFLTFVFLFIPDIRVFIKTIAVMAVLVFLVIVTGIQLGRLQDAGSFLGTNPLSSFFLSNFDKIANRFIYWLDPEKDALGLGYQLLKARESILLGGWFGTSSVTDLPVKTSDLVYPALIQRCGMVFAILVFFIFILMWLEGIRLFIRKADRYHQAVGAGFVFMLFDQTLIIIAGSTGLCPLTGITLPFISSGGSSLFVTFVMVGVMIAISSNVKWKGMTDDEEEFFKENAVIAKCHAYLRHLNDHIPRPDLRAAAGRLRGGRPTEAGSKGKHVSKGVRPGKNFGQRGKHSRRVRKTAGKKNVQ